MKLKNCARCLRIIFGWLLIVVGGLFGVSAEICAFLALIGMMEIDSFGNRLIVFVTAL